MKKAVLLASALALAMVPSPAFAKGNPHGKDKKEAKHHDRDHDRDDHHGKKDRDREHRVSHNSGRPPGWDKGKKTGWGDCDVPPGQAKKIGCHGHSTRVTHTRHERRPVVISQNPRSPRTTPYPRTTTATTRTTTRTPTTTRGTHPFEPVLREKQQRGTGSGTGPRQSTK